jgi:hypothetical protein
MRCEAELMSLQEPSLLFADFELPKSIIVSDRNINLDINIDTRLKDVTHFPEHPWGESLRVLFEVDWAAIGVESLLHWSRSIFKVARASMVTSVKRALGSGV